MLEPIHKTAATPRRSLDANEAWLRTSPDVGGTPLSLNVCPRITHRTPHVHRRPRGRHGRKFYALNPESPTDALSWQLGVYIPFVFR